MPSPNPSYPPSRCCRYADKQLLFDAGRERIALWCKLNSIDPPSIQHDPIAARLGTCAFYRGRPTPTISIHVPACAAIGTAGPCWSYPGYFVDRTPYGVLAHELGHHVDFLNAKKTRGAYFSDFSVSLRAASGEPKLTNYCENDGEWFAEMFRLFVTNPDLLRIMRPHTFKELHARFALVEDLPWKQVLYYAPGRNIARIYKLVGVSKAWKEHTC